MNNKINLKVPYKLYSCINWKNKYLYINWYTYRKLSRLEQLELKSSILLLYDVFNVEMYNTIRFKKLVIVIIVILKLQAFFPALSPLIATKMLFYYSKYKIILQEKI